MADIAVANRFGVPRWHDESAAAIRDDLTHAADVGADDGRRDGKRFDDDSGHAFPRRRQHGGIRRGHAGRHVVPQTQQRDDSVELQRRHSIPCFLAQGALAGDRKP